MAILTVSGVPIPIAPTGARRDWLDATDRARAFDNTYRVSVTGNPKRDWPFSTPPIARQLSDFYESILTSNTSQTIAGDIPGGSSNLLLRSEEFDNAAWTKGAATITANSTTAPNGTSTADALVESAASADHYAIQPIALTASTAYTLSIFGKPNSRQWLRLYTLRKDGTSVNSWVNLSTGLAGTVGAGHTVSLLSYGNGWFRAWATYNSLTGGTATEIGYALATADAQTGYLGDGVQNLWLWGAQLNTGSTPNSYVKTTSAAVAAPTLNGFTEITGWSAVSVRGSHYVVLDFVVHEA